MNLFLTGGSRGIGRATVLAAVEAGHDVVFTWVRDQGAARQTVALAAERAPDRRCEALQLDVRDSAAVDAAGDAAVDLLGEFDAVICNAGITQDGLAFSMTDEAWADVLAVNLTGAFYVARRFLPELLATQGSLVFLSSIATHGIAGQANYSASKAGVLGLMRALAKEYGPRGVRSNAVVPGFFETDMTRGPGAAGLAEFWKDLCPLRRPGQLDEVAAAVLYLAGPSASFVNGHALPVTGGLDWAR